ncbi:hypothetical protein O0I10_011659 [Lichtheimia ornata]|uniref:F-box domain-containing protein n=1 Tax=Lichtheimia ornata TaxID=688661 RepID=A0AAD7XQA6_9FUNG|nr:uncharacterized protein O0I10_011659 [Lichtheimia ornata]KAJ8652714.1 hypothetical protein O0I10_011659 [Lichtheimia ornata]
MTVEGNISWSELLKPTITTAQHDNDDNRIAMATETLKQAARRFVEVLNERARLLAKSAQFETALRDAAAIRAILPESGLGYLCNGDIYGQQGHYNEAIAIYDQGLEAVPHSDPYYQQLQQNRMEAVINNNKRVDFISRLPLDIVITNIIPRMEPAYLDPDVLYEPLYVSRTWQERILQQPKGLKFQFRRAVVTFKNGHAQLIRFAPYVQTLSASLLDVHLDDLFSRAHFSNLKELEVFSPHGSTPRLPLIHGLQIIADSLTHLAVYQCPGLELGDLLQTCPNLVSLKTMRVDAIRPLSSSYPKIKLLELDERLDQTHTHDHMVDVLSRFPSLRMLKISPMPATTILPILHKHCPYLQAVSLGCRSPDFDVTAANGHLNRKGITSAYLGHAKFYQDDVTEFLYQQRDSLEILEFHGKLEVNNARWKISADGRVQPHSTSLRIENDLSSPVSFTRLVDLRFTDIAPYIQDVPMLQWIVWNAPSLNAIDIPLSYFQPDIAKAMIKLNHLKRVQIVDNDINSEILDDNDDGLQQFFDYHVAMGDRSTLEHVVVQMDFLDAAKQTWLSLLSRLRCLKILEIGGDRSVTYCTIDDNCIPIIKRIRRDCHALEKLMVNGKVPIWLSDS